MASVATNTNPFPIRITLSESVDSEITSTQILAGHHVRKIIDTSNASSSSTVAAFGKDFVQHKPDWLNMICQKHYNGSSDFNAIVSFGDGNDLVVKVRKRTNHNGGDDRATSKSTSSKKSSSKKDQQQKPNVPFVSFRLSVFLNDGTAGLPPDMLDPRDDFNMIMQASCPRGPLQLIICPSTDNKRPRSNFDHDATTNNESNSIVLLIDNDDDGQDVVQILDNDKDALINATKDQNGGEGGLSDHESDKKKKKKDPNAPHAKQSAYTFFMAEIRSQLKEHNPNASFSDLSKLVGQKWRTLDQSEKDKFAEMAAKDKVRYEDEMAVYVSNGGPGGAAATANDHDANETSKKKKKKDPNQPKAPRNRYVLFCSEMRSKIKDENPDYDGTRINAELNRMYAGLSDAEKEKYDKRAEDDKARYNREMETYKKGKQGVTQEENDELEADEDEEPEPEVPKTVEKQTRRAKQDNDDDIEEESSTKKSSSSKKGRRSTRKRLQSPDAVSSKKKKGKKKKRKSIDK